METIYKDKLRNPLWQKKRNTILQRDNYTCQLCTDEKTELHVHHKKYTGEPWEAPDEDLETLCRHCHKAETEASKIGEELFFAMKTGTNYFGRTKKGKIIIGKIEPDNDITLALIVHQPKQFAEILSILIK